MEAAQISNEDNYLRRVPVFLPNYIKQDGSITRLAFTPRRGDDGLSGDVERPTKYETAILDPMRFRLLRINVKVIRIDINDGLDVIHSPVEGNYAHCLIIGNITEGKAKQLLLNSNEVTSQ